jgi:hypothetical protein
MHARGQPWLTKARQRRRARNFVAAIEARLRALGLALPEPLILPPGVTLPFPWVRVHGNRAYVSGHAAQNADGSLAGPLGKVGLEVSLEQAQHAARLTALSILASLKRELGDLDRISAWLRAFGMVNCAPGFKQMPAVINGFTELIVELRARRAGCTRARRWAWQNCRSAFPWRSRPRWRSMPDAPRNAVAGYSSAPLAQKLGIKSGNTLRICGAPAGYLKSLAPLPPHVRIAGRLSASVDFAHVFTSDRAALQKTLVAYRATLKPTAVVWVSWPKKASGVRAEVTEDVVRHVALPLGFVDVKVCAIDNVWSGLKLVVRKELR